jgi:hypothetical protein
MNITLINPSFGDALLSLLHADLFRTLKPPVRLVFLLRRLPSFFCLQHKDTRSSAYRHVYRLKID